MKLRSGAIPEEQRSPLQDSLLQRGVWSAKKTNRAEFVASSPPGAPSSTDRRGTEAATLYALRFALATHEKKRDLYEEAYKLPLSQLKERQSCPNTNGAIQSIVDKNNSLSTVGQSHSEALGAL